MKDFDAWNNYKKKINNRVSAKYIKEGEIWWCALGVNIGSEQDGNNRFERPVLVIKKFTKTMYLVIPLSRKNKVERCCYKIEENSFALLLQVRAIDRRRLLRKMSVVNYSKVRDIFTCLCKLVYLKNRKPHI